MSVEFVLIFVSLVGLVLLVAQVALAYFNAISATDAAERAARAAATLPIAHCAALRNADGERLHLPADPEAPRPVGALAAICLNAPSPCLAQPESWTCAISAAGETGAECDARAMRAILDAARGVGAPIETVEVTWSDSRLGELGGEVVPLISVTVRRGGLSLRNPVFGDVGGPSAATSAMVGEAVGRGRWEGPRC